MSFISIILLIIIVIPMCIYEKKKYGTYITPIFLLSIPFLIVVFGAEFFWGYFGFYPLNYEIVFVWIYGLIIFFLIGNFVTLGYKNKTNIVIYRNHSASVNKNCKYITAILIAMIYFSLFYTFLMQEESFTDFAEECLGGGFWGHYWCLLQAIGIYFIGKINNKDLPGLVLIGLIILLGFFAGIKGDIVIIFFGGCIFRILSGKMRFKVRYIIIAALIACIIFFIMYLYDFSIEHGEINQDDFAYIFNHLGYYIFSGIGGFGEYIKLGYSFDLTVLFNPIYTVLIALGFINGEYNNIINQPIQVGPKQSTNVATLFGEVYMRGGLVGILLFTSVIAVIVYLLFRRSRQGYMFSSMAYSYYAVLLIMALFGNSFWRLSALEVPMIFGTLWLLNKMVLTGKKGLTVKER